MAPTRRKTTTEANPTRRIMTRSIYKKQQQTIMSSPEAVASAVRASANGNSIDTISNNESCQNSEASTNSHDSLCSTPKGEKYRIPKISTCPPAPKKKRLVLNCLSIKGSSTSSSPSTKFFAHSDVEVFFLLAPQNIHS